MRIDIPEGKDPINYVLGRDGPGHRHRGPRCSRWAVYEHSTLGLREFEAARLTIAQVNGCLFLPRLAHRA